MAISQAMQLRSKLVSPVALYQDDPSPRGHLAMPGDSFGCPDFGGGSGVVNAAGVHFGGGQKRPKHTCSFRQSLIPSCLQSPFLLLSTLSAGPAGDSQLSSC